MLISAEKIAAVPTDSAAYHTGMLDLNSRAVLIQENISDAIPYMYVSFSNIIFQLYLDCSNFRNICYTK